MMQKDEIKKLKASLSLPDYFENLVETGQIEGPMLRQNGEYHICCPFHLEDTPSFRINDERFHCFGCGKHGDIFAAIMHFEGLTFKEILREYGGRSDRQYGVVERECKLPWNRPEQERLAACKRVLPRAALLRALLYEGREALASMALISIHETTRTPNELAIICKHYKLEDSYSGKMKALLIYEELCSQTLQYKKH
jgi:hypothetical protein